MGGEEGPNLKKQKVEDEAAEASSGSDGSRGPYKEEDSILGFYLSEIEKNPDIREQYRRYNEIVEKSDGFETIKLPPGDNFGAILEMGLDIEENMNRVTECGEYAVQEYNKGTTEPYSKLSTGQEGDLVLRDVIKTNYSGTFACYLYITVRAENTVSMKTSVFQAKVYSRRNNKKVMLFRPQPLLCD